MTHDKQRHKDYHDADEERAGVFKKIPVIRFEYRQIDDSAHRAPDQLSYYEARNGGVALRERGACAVDRGKAEAEEDKSDDDHYPVRVGADVAPACGKFFSHR